MGKKIFSLAIMLLLLSTTVFADGMICYNDGSGNCAPYRQAKQSAIINQENGFENLLIFVNTQGYSNSEKFVWIFPVPANPTQIQIDNLKSFPSFSGTELKKQFKDNVNNLAALNFVSLFPPAAILYLFQPVYYATGFGGQELTADKANAVDRGYEIWQHIDKYGIATEVMTAWDTAKFYHYLEARGTNLSPEAKALIEEYVNKPNYSFVISWISNPEEYRQAGNATNEYGDYYYNYNQEPIGVFARFPTEKIFYPMRLTSVYQEQQLPVNIDIVGFVQPEIYSNISKETKIGFYSNDRLQYGLNEEASAKTVFNGNIPSTLKFTRISINAQAKYFIKDIEFAKVPALSAIALDAINALWIPIAIIIFFLLSFLAVVITNKLLLQNVLNAKQTALLAAANFFSFIGYVIAVFVMKTQLKEKDKTKFSRLKAIPMFWATFFALSIAFLILAIILNAIIV